MGRVVRLAARLRNYWAGLKDMIHQDRRVFAVFLVLRALVVLVLVRCAIRREFEGLALCILVLILFMVPPFLEKSFKIDIPPMLQITIYLFIFAAEIMGEVNHFYVQIPGWDTVLHTINGFLAAAVGFSMLYLLNRRSAHFSLSPFYLAMVAFCFSMTIGVLWEFGECAMDQFLGQDAQKDTIVQSFGSVTLDPKHEQRVVHVDGIRETVIRTKNGDVTIHGGYLDIGLLDTMKDLFVNFVGALAFSFIGYGLASGERSPRSRLGMLVSSLLVWPDDGAPSSRALEELVCEGDAAGERHDDTSVGAAEAEEES